MTSFHDIDDVESWRKSVAVSPRTPVLDRCRRCPLRTSGPCAALVSSEIWGVRPPHLRRIDRDGSVFGNGQEDGALGIVRSGILRRERISRGGRRMLLGLSVPGDTVDDVSVRYSGDSLEAATDAEVCVIGRASVRRMMSDDENFRRAVMEKTSDMHTRELEMIWRRGALTSRERIMAFLVMAATIMPVEPQPDGSAIVTIELSRQDWADLSNTSVESISRVLSHLSDKGLVRNLNRQRYWIRDLDLLARLAGVDPEPRDLDTPKPAGNDRTGPVLRAVDGGRRRYG